MARFGPGDRWLAECQSAAEIQNPAVSTINRMRTERLVRLIGRDDRPVVDSLHDEDFPRNSPASPERRVPQNAAPGAGGDRRAAAGRRRNSRTDHGDARAESSRDRSRACAGPGFDLVYHSSAARQDSESLRLCPLGRRASPPTFSLEVAAKQFAIAKAER